MMRTGDYLRATRHPWPILVLLLPLLTTYESGVLILGGSNSDSLRNGADAWLRYALDSFGLNHLIVAPLTIAAVFAVWSWLRRDDRPDSLLTVCCGMLLECFLFALLLWGISHAFAPFLDRIGVPLNSISNVDPVVTRIITFVGAGIYEEILFRLILFSGLRGGQCNQTAARKHDDPGAVPMPDSLSLCQAPAIRHERSRLRPGVRLVNYGESAAITLLRATDGGVRYKINRLKSVFFAKSPMCFCT